MRARDAGVSVVAVVAGFLALQGTPDVDIQLRWMVGERPLPVEGGLPVPLPLVTDLDGDGKNEVVVLADGGMLIRVLSVPVASGETLVDPWIIHSTLLRQTRRLGRDERAVAMAAGYLEPPINARDPGSSRQQQRIVVVGEDSSVTCFNHQLGRLWTNSLAHEGSSSGEGGSFVIDQVAITVAHSVRKLDDRGRPKPGTAEGLIVVGISMRHRDGRFHHSRAGRDPSGGSVVDGADPLGVHVEAFVDGEEDSRDTVEQEKMSEEEKGRRAAEHFSLFALDGETGEVRWSHGGGAHRGAQDKQNGGGGGGGGGGDGSSGISDYEYFDFGFDLDYPGFGDDLLYNQAEGAAAAPAFEGLAAVAGAVGGGGGRRYRRSLLNHLPHAWSAPSDTRLEITALHRRGTGDRRNGVSVGGVGGEGGGEDHPAAGGRRLPGVGGGSVGSATGGGGLVRVVLARTRDGLEAVELSTGKPLSAVALPAAAGTDAGLYVDLNGDGVVDHVQAVGTRGGQGWGHLHEGVAMGHLSEEPTTSQPARRFLPPCYALAVSGLPPREQLFNASLCHDAGALFEVQERLSKPNSRSSSRSLDLEVGAASPAIIPRGSAGTGAAATGAAARSSSGAERGARSGGGGGGEEGPARFDAVFAVSSGVVSSYDDEGRLKWQDRRGPKWTRKDAEGGDPNNGGGYVVPFTLEVGWPAGGRRRITNPSAGAEERILVVGQDKMCVYDRGGRLAGSTPLAAPPSQRPVLGDFDGDGVADVLVVGWSGAVAGYALAPDPGVRAMFVAVLALVAAMLVVAAVHVPPPPSSSSRGGGGATRHGTGLAGGKSKRATD